MVYLLMCSVTSGSFQVSFISQHTCFKNYIFDFTPTTFIKSQEVIALDYLMFGSKHDFSNIIRCLKHYIMAIILQYLALMLNKIRKICRIYCTTKRFYNTY